MSKVVKVARLNRRGFSLVELIVSFAILGVIAVAVFAFMFSGSQMYGVVSQVAGIQLDIQVAMAQIQEYVIDCNGGMAFVDGTDKTLYVANRVEDSIELHTFLYIEADKSIYYGVQTILPSQDADLSAPGDVLADSVKAFNVKMPSGGSVKSAEISMTIEKKSKSQSLSQKIALRNRAVAEENATKLLDKLRTE